MDRNLIPFLLTAIILFALDPAYSQTASPARITTSLHMGWIPEHA